MLSKHRFFLSLLTLITSLRSAIGLLSLDPARLRFKAAAMSKTRTVVKTVTKTKGSAVTSQLPTPPPLMKTAPSCLSVLSWNIDGLLLNYICKLLWTDFYNNLTCAFCLYLCYRKVSATTRARHTLSTECGRSSWRSSRRSQTLSVSRK